jgi:hypothetical protein
MLISEFHILKLRKVGEIECYTLSNQRILPVNPKIYEFEGKTYLTYYDYETQYLFLNQLSGTDKVIRQDTINLHLDFKSGYQNLMSYSLISLDSLLVSYNASTQKYGTHDSSIVLINSKGNFLSTVNMNDANVITWNKVPNGTISKVPLRYRYPYYVNNMKLPLLYDRRKNAIITTLARFQFDSPDVKQYRSELGYSFLNGRAFQYIKQTDLLEFDSNYYYGIDIHYIRGCYNTKTNELIIGTGNSSNLIIIDSTQNGRKERIKSVSLDTIYPLITPYKEFNNFNQGEFLNIIYSPYDNHYFRMIRIGNNRFSNKSELSPKRREDNETFVCQIINKDLKAIGEGIIPSEYGYPIPYSKGKVLFFNKIQSKLRGKLVFDICQIDLIKADTLSYLNQLRGVLESNKVATASNYAAFVKRVTPPGYKFYFIINMDNTCSSCKEAFVSYYLAHQKVLEKQSSIAIVVLTSNFKKERSIFGFKDIPNNFFVDDKGIHKEFVGASEHITWLTYNERSTKVKFYQAGEMHELYGALSELIK